MAHQGLNAAGNRRALLIVFLLTLGYLVVEIVAGILTHSLALIADAVHMATDAGSLALAAFAAWMAEQEAPLEKTYGYYRLEILAALANGMLLLFSAVYILYEAYRRFQTPRAVAGIPMLVVAVIGLIVNLVGIRILRGHAEENLNVASAFYEIAKDALGSVGVIVAGAVILTTGWPYADPIASALIAVFILPRTWTLLRKAVDILLEAAPAGVDVAAVERAICDVAGVEKVHDLHVWTITSGFDSLSAHVVLDEDTDRRRAQGILEDIDRCLRNEFNIQHTTIQLEYESLWEQEPQR